MFRSHLIPAMVASAAALLSSAHVVQAQTQPIKVMVDVTDAPRKILHAQLTIPVHDGANTLVYPKWIPGEHGPTGPIDNLAGLKFMADGKEIAWRRDDVDMYAFHLNVPQGVTSLDVKLDFLATAAASGFSAGASTSANLAMLSWNEVALYPEGTNAADVMFAPSVKLPEGWQYGTALEKIGGGAVDPVFKTVSLEQLVDSPLLAGKYFREVPLAPEISPKHYIDLAADGPEDLELKPESLAAFGNLVRETGALYKSRHYGSYHFLVTLSDQVAHFGLEHHQSSDDRVPEKTFLDPDLELLSSDLLPHEFTHSWNGKYRRPAGLATPNYQVPMKGNLLWVYEGLTQYLGDVLAGRSHIWSEEQYREYLAMSAAEMDARPGRTWRDLEDTAVAAQILYGTGSEWDNWRRSVDYYPEGELVWLDVDTTLRKLSKDKKSINDFCALFYGLHGNTAPEVIPYTFDDLVAALNQVVPNDWAAFLHERLNTKADHAPLEGIQQGGYQLVYDDKPSDYTKAAETVHEEEDAWWSIGIDVENSGRVSDVLVGSPADKAGFGPGMTVVAVNGRAYTSALLKDALDRSKTTNAPMEFIVANTGYYKVLHVDYHGGQRYPHLEAIKGQKDLLAEILKPMTK